MASNTRSVVEVLPINDAGFVVYEICRPSDPTKDRFAHSRLHGGSGDAERAVLDLTDGKSDGRLQGYVWTAPYINGEEHLLTVEGHHPSESKEKPPVVLRIHQVGAGYSGVGPDAAVTILTHLRLGTPDYLRRIIHARRGSDSWKQVLTPAQLTPHSVQPDKSGNIM